ncbi:MAG: molybdopterin converting factor subunit 1 [Chromatiales bacterium]|jgi:molybdopterin synthase sulfur carrier subunit
MIHMLYFASLRERLGVGAEDIELPSASANVAGLLEHLRSRGGTWSEALAPDRAVLVAVNQEMAQEGTSLEDGDEVGLFPPVTGG